MKLIRKIYGEGYMSEIKSHKCPSCGGNLSINFDMQTYLCPFCGSTFDYEYFREDQMHEMGNTYLSRGEFSAAIDAYKYLLQKDPHDFIALRGIMLASAQMKGIKNLSDSNNFRKFTYNTKLVESSVEGSSAEDKDYFEELRRLFREIHVISKLNKERDALEVERSRTRSKLNMTSANLSEYSFIDEKGDTHDPELGFAIMCVITGLLALVTTGLYLFAIFSSIFGGEVSALIVVSFIATVVTFAAAMITFKIMYPLAQGAKKHKLKLKEAKAELDNISIRLEMLEKEVHSRVSVIKHDCLLFFKEDERRMARFS